MNVYENHLPLVFPVAIYWSQGRVLRAVRNLLDNSNRFPIGSSFAVSVANAEEGYQWLWLSLASAKRISLLLPNQGVDDIPPELSSKRLSIKE